MGKKLSVAVNINNDGLFMGKKLSVAVNINNDGFLGVVICGDQEE